jgi:hypothetical protein
MSSGMIISKEEDDKKFLNDLLTVLKKNNIYTDASFQDVNIKDSAKIIKNIMQQISTESQKKLTEDLLHLLDFTNITKDADDGLNASYGKTFYKKLIFADFSDPMFNNAKNINIDGLITIRRFFEFSFYYFDSKSNQEKTLISITEQTLNELLKLVSQAKEQNKNEIIISSPYDTQSFKIYLGESESAGYKIEK